MNELDSKAQHASAIDSLLNYETVKYFNNEDFEARRYDESLRALRSGARSSRRPRCRLLNIGQQLIIAIGRDADPVARDAGRGRRHA